jgi:DNA-binding NarL/FixJ family response regulator
MTNTGRNPSRIPRSPYHYAHDMLTTFESNEEVQRALKAGACGYLLKGILPGSSYRQSVRYMRANSRFHRKRLIPGLLQIRLSYPGC